MNLSEEMGKMAEVIEKYKDELRKNNDLYRCYLAPNIPDKIGRKLVKYYDSNLAVNRRLFQVLCKHKKLI